MVTNWYKSSPAVAHGTRTKVRRTIPPIHHYSFSFRERKYSPFFIIVQLRDLCRRFCTLMWN